MPAAPELIDQRTATVRQFFCHLAPGAHILFGFRALEIPLGIGAVPCQESARVKGCFHQVFSGLVVGCRSFPAVRSGFQFARPIIGRAKSGPFDELLRALEVLTRGDLHALLLGDLIGYRLEDFRLPPCPFRLIRLLLLFRSGRWMRLFRGFQMSIGIDPPVSEPELHRRGNLLRELIVTGEQTQQQDRGGESLAGIPDGILQQAPKYSARAESLT